MAVVMYHFIHDKLAVGLMCRISGWRGGRDAWVGRISCHSDARTAIVGHIFGLHWERCRGREVLTQPLIEIEVGLEEWIKTDVCT